MRMETRSRILALDPDDNIVSIIMDDQGNVVTDLAELPVTVAPADALRVDINDDLRIT